MALRLRKRPVRCLCRWWKKDGRSTPVAEQVARIYLDEAFTGDFKSADVLVLGCTHYPLLKPLLQKLVPEPRDNR